MKRAQIVFCTQRYESMCKQLVARGNYEAGAIERKLFPDGERYTRILTDIRGRDVVLLGGTVTDEDTLELYDLACGLVHDGCHILSMAIPWFGYQTMERAIKRGEIVTAKTRAQLLSSIPIAGSGTRIFLFDLHSEGITQYFSGDVRPVHIYAKDLVFDAIRELADSVSRDALVIGATDAGRAKWVESLANDLGVDAAFVFKRRLSGDETEVTALAADVSGKMVIIYDDMIRTGGSLIGAARAYRNAGATRIAAVTTHGVFPGESIKKLEDSGLFEAIVCTDSHPGAKVAQRLAPSFLRVKSLEIVLHQALSEYEQTVTP